MANSVDVKVSSGDAIVASFKNAGEVRDVGLNVYEGKKNGSIVHGESLDGTLQYDGEELNESQYVIGIYDKKQGEIKILPTKFFSGRVKSNTMLINDAKLNKKLKRTIVEGTFAERRNALGEEFGTKKAKKAISEAARNRIDAGLLEDSQVDIIDGIRETTKSMPNREEMAKIVEIENRVIPKCYPEATNVEDIYPINEIVFDEILEIFPIDIIINNEGKLIDKIKLLPFLPSIERGDEQLKNGIFGKIMEKLVESTSSIINEDIKYQLRLLSFTSMLVGLYFNRRLNKKEKLIENFNNKPPLRAINYMLNYFGNSKFKKINYDRDVKFYTIGPKEEDKLLCHIIILILTLCEFRIDLNLIASELNLKPSRLIALVRTLGCSIMVANKSDGKDKSGNKMAVLRVPFKVPELVKRFKR
ncbi:hypothetical protein CANINC_004192 [Pichia inconspicua]|uniref:DNA-directed RNA polymerase I subunit RPA49 n=1 Tax=Pichia inconspicua TaxID=52247 RepID=A0A4T0WXV9_9ASCO|nr:hypothetical protein CANINC_004192 [[Candida] inconspicua]